jgi:hypothetical protein
MGVFQKRIRGWGMRPGAAVLEAAPGYGPVRAMAAVVSQGAVRHDGKRRFKLLRTEMLRGKGGQRNDVRHESLGRGIGGAMGGGAAEIRGLLAAPLAVAAYPAGGVRGAEPVPPFAA